MRLCILAPNAGFMDQAGTRIRYNRLRERLAEQGVTLETQLVAEFRRDTKLEHDAYVISKCYDVRSILLLRSLSRAGRLTGVDLFDDYFSQDRDARFVHLRQWLRELAGTLDFVLCSTSRMREVVEVYAPGLPTHVINDPLAALDVEAIGATVARNLAAFRETRRVHIGWFGVGDNPYFNVGLTDLVAFAPQLAPLRGRGYTLELQILTNSRALKADSLAMLRRLPLNFSVDEWSEEAERALIANSLFCLLPVNAQRFSIAKSLNRAVTTLTGGAQVLSSGYPLYGRLDAFVYRDPVRLIRDAEAGTPKLSAETLPQLCDVMQEWADPGREAERLAAFLRTLPGRRAADGPLGGTRPRFAVLHGKRSTGEVHKFAQGMGQLSVATPFSGGGLNYDITFSAAAGKRALDLEISEAAAALLSPQGRERLVKLSPPSGKRSNLLPDAIVDDVLLSRLAALRASGEILAATSYYAPAMGGLVRVLQDIIPTLTIVVSESDPLFSLPAGPVAALPRKEDATDAA